MTTHKFSGIGATLKYIGQKLNENSFLVFSKHCETYLHSGLHLPASSLLQPIFLSCAKDVWYVLRHWASNQQDLRVGLGFLHAVILRMCSTSHTIISPPNDAFTNAAVTRVPNLLVFFHSNFFSDSKDAL